MYECGEQYIIISGFLNSRRCSSRSFAIPKLKNQNYETNHYTYIKKDMAYISPYQNLKSNDV